MLLILYIKYQNKKSLFIIKNSKILIVLIENYISNINKPKIWFKNINIINIKNL